jgi:Mrp family chromosome partitioning ATPase
MADTVEVVQAVEERPTPTLEGAAEEIFRGMWASLFYSGRVTGKGVVICSASRQEGASTIATGLALAGSSPTGIARMALVDFNLRDPAIHDLLGLKGAPGVAEVIAEGLGPEVAAQKVAPALDFYAAGNVGDRILNVLRSEGLSRFLSVLSQGYDHVLIDAPAANHYPDAQVLAGVVKNVVLVAHTERTPREAVAQARKRLEAFGGKVVGLVLNLRSYPIPRFLYGRV